MKKALVAMALAAHAAAGVSTASAEKPLRLKLTYSGTAMSTHANTNGDGINTGLGTVACRSNLGRCTAQGVGEALLGGPTTCPNGHAGFLLTLLPGTGWSITRFDRTGDMLFTELTSETVCYDPSTRMHFKTGTGRITGGTGRFAHATGELQFEGSQRVLYVDADGNGFAAQEGTETGTIILAE